jgi:hypothetical protein
MTMPNFLLIGAMKAGTTAFYQHLDQHPQVYMSPFKEPNFFAFEGEKLDFRAPSDIEGLNRYAVTEIEEYRALFDGVSGEKAVGEASHWYMYKAEASERIKHHIPEARLIAVLRDPAERAYSEFLHFVRDGDEPITDFAEALRQEKARIRANWTMGLYVDRGYYYTQLKRYFDRFDRDQIRIYLYEDLRDDPEFVMRETFRFLKVDDTFVPDTSIRPNVSGVPKNKALHVLLNGSRRAKAVFEPILPAGAIRYAKDLRSRNLVKPQMPPETRRQLVATYREEILNLQDLIQRDLSSWLEV